MNLDILNNRQKQAVLHTEGPLLVLAGAGSGKTRVLTYRIAYLIEDKAVYPSAILALTFTNKAAKEMKQRVGKLLGKDADALWMGTFHSICVRILRAHADIIGYTKNFVIYDTADQKSLIKSVMKTLNISDKELKVSFVKAMISEAKNEMLTPQMYKSLEHTSYQLKQVSRIYEAYQAALIKNDAMDFDDLLINTLELFKKSAETRQFYSNKFRYIHVDEYQDTNLVQYKLIKTLSQEHGNLCVVGDNDQSIYGWRGADIRNIQEFDRDFKGTEVVMLEQNYRSTKRILEAANSVIKNNANRKDKNLWTDSAEGEPIYYYKGNDNNDEARFVANQIISGFERGESYGDYAVLYRTNAQSRNFEEAFIRSGIPYKIIGGHKFYERLEIKDMLAYLRVVANPSDAISLLRIINVPKRGLGNMTITKLQALAATHQLSLYDTILYTIKNSALSKRVLTGLIDFVKVVDDLIKRSDEMRGSEILQSILDKTGYRAELELESTPEAMSRVENLDELLSQMMNFEQVNENGSLNDYLQEISLLSDQDDEAFDEQGYTLLMTIHAAKGLEFNNVFLVGMEERLFPSQMALEEDDGIDEERRLCYVGITRAKKKLYLTHTNIRNRFGRTEVNPMSRFIEEIPLDIIHSFSGEVATSKSNSIYFGVSDHVKCAKNDCSIANSTTFKVGARVRHKVFGDGMIVTIKNDDLLVVAFDKKGVKQLSATMAPLTIIE